MAVQPLPYYSTSTTSPPRSRPPQQQPCQRYQETTLEGVRLVVSYHASTRYLKRFCDDGTPIEVAQGAIKQLMRTAVFVQKNDDGSHCYVSPENPLCSLACVREYDVLTVRTVLDGYARVARDAGRTGGKIPRYSFNRDVNSIAPGDDEDAPWNRGRKKNSHRRKHSGR